MSTPVVHTARTSAISNHLMLRPATRNGLLTSGRTTSFEFVVVFVVLLVVDVDIIVVEVLLV